MENANNNFIEMFMKNTGLNINEVAELYTLFLVELDSEIKELKSAFYYNEYKNAQQIVHNIKGISSNYLVNSVYKISQEIDILLKEDITDNIDTKINCLFNETEKIKTTIFLYFKSKNIELEV